MQPDAFEGFPENLANTYDLALPEPEFLGTVSDLGRFLKKMALPVVHPLSNDDLADVHAVRDMVRAVFLATSSLEAMTELNELLLGVKTELRVLQSDSKSPIQLRVLVSDKTGENVRSVAAIALARTVERLGFSRLGVCQADPCRDMFVDTSKKGAQRFCSSRCASRTHVAAFRQRLAFK